jgi:hypothetical protein
MSLARRSWFLALAMVTAGLTAGCNRSAPPDGQATKPSPAPAAPAAAVPAPAGGKAYGAALATQQPMPIADLLAKPEQWKDKTVTVEGKVRKACTRKGCWMEVAAADGAEKPASPGCRVTFKDYGFFVPTDSAGAHARVQGVVEVDTLSASMVRHYEEEGAVFPAKRPDGTAPEVRIVASGVVLSRVK